MLSSNMRNSFCLVFSMIHFSRQAFIVAALAIGSACYAVAASAEETPLPKKAETFEVNGHTAFLYAAPKPAPGKPWVWFAPTLKGVSLVGRKVYFQSFLSAGISIAGCDLGE